MSGWNWNYFIILDYLPCGKGREIAWNDVLLVWLFCCLNKHGMIGAFKLRDDLCVCIENTLWWPTQLQQAKSSSNAGLKRYVHPSSENRDRAQRLSCVRDVYPQQWAHKSVFWDQRQCELNVVFPHLNWCVQAHPYCTASRSCGPDVLADHELQSGRFVTAASLTLHAAQLGVLARVATRASNTLDASRRGHHFADSSADV